MAEDPALTAAVAGVTDAVFAAFENHSLTKADIRGEHDRWPFDGLQLAIYRTEVKQAQTLKEIKDFAMQMVRLRDSLEEAKEMIDEDPTDDGAVKLKVKLEEDVRKYRRMAESFFRGGPRWHIRDMA